MYSIETHHKNYIYVVAPSPHDKLIQIERSSINQSINSPAPS